MGTVVTFDVRTPAPQEQVDAALASATRWLHWVDDTFSTYKPNSEVNRFDRGELPIDECCEELKQVVALCYKFNGATGGFFDAWASGHFDPSGIVKGWSVERASGLLKQAGLPDHAIDGGGDVRLSGPRERAGPGMSGSATRFNATRTAPRCRSWAGAVATSGTYERGLHVINPFSRRAGNRADRRHGRGAGAHKCGCLRHGCVCNGRRRTSLVGTPGRLTRR